MFPKDTVLVAMYGATAGQVGILRFEATTNQAICGVLPNKQFIPDFLYYFLKSKKNALVAQADGNAQPNISQNKIRNTEVPLAPLSDQQRITSILKAIDDLRQKQRKALELTRQMIPALFYEMFSLDQFRTNVLKDLVKIHYGKALKNSNRKTGACPVFGSNGCIGFHDEALVKSPTIIIGRKGSVGKVIFAENGGWPIDTTYYVEPVEKIDLFYLYWALKLSNLERLAISTSLPGLNRNTLYATPILVPPIELQNMFTQKAQESLSLLMHQELSLKKLDLLFESMLHEVFGEKE